MRIKTWWICVAIMQLPALIMYWPVPKTYSEPLASRSCQQFRSLLSPQLSIVVPRDSSFAAGFTNQTADNALSYAQVNSGALKRLDDFKGPLGHLDAEIMQLASSVSELVAENP